MRTILLSIAVIALTQCKSDKQAAGGPPPAMPVQVATPVMKLVELSETYTGRFTPIEEVALQARVSGYLESVHFTEGQKVEKGNLMFRIDPRVFDAAVSRSEAMRKQAVARLGLAESNYATADKLVKQSAVSREEFNTRASELAQAEADVLFAEANLRSAKLDREFAEIQAPISGIAGSFNVTVGNFISGGGPGATLLTTIVPQHPMHCDFEIDERRALELKQLFSEEKPEVVIAVSNSDGFPFKGRIDFTENKLDSGTATLRMRALVDNVDGSLTPGIFARVRVPLGAPAERMLVRDAALGFDQDKRFAWVVKADGATERRYVETGGLEKDMRIVTGGLAADETIAVSAIQLIGPGAVVAPSTVPMIQDGGTSE